MEESREGEGEETYGRLLQHSTLTEQTRAHMAISLLVMIR